MRADFSVVEGAYLRDILDQPRALEETLAELEDLGSLCNDLRADCSEGKFKTVVLTGMGSSFHALHPLNIELIDHGFTASWWRLPNFCTIRIGCSIQRP